MFRTQTLLTLIYQAQANGFEFRRWYQSNIHNDFPGVERSVDVLVSEGRFYALIFSHDFARAIWKRGAQMHFEVPSMTYSRMNGKGEVVTINRKPFTRRTIKADVWKYHLREMAVSPDPMLYLKRFVPAGSLLNSTQEVVEMMSAAG